MIGLALQDAVLMKPMSSIFSASFPDQHGKRRLSATPCCEAHVRKTNQQEQYCNCIQW